MVVLGMVFPTIAYLSSKLIDGVTPFFGIQFTKQMARVIGDLPPLIPDPPETAYNQA